MLDGRHEAFGYLADHFQYRRHPSYFFIIFWFAQIALPDRTDIRRAGIVPIWAVLELFRESAYISWWDQRLPDCGAATLEIDRIVGDALPLPLVLHRHDIVKLSTIKDQVDQANRAWSCGGCVCY